jgi:hypothetical protein
MWKVRIMHSFCILSIHWNVFYHIKHHGHVGIKKEIGPFPRKWTAAMDPIDPFQISSEHNR